jgi:DNA mismatch endonuclease (patch repair protein)
LTNTTYWTAKLERNRARDAEVDQRLVEAGWQVVRVWEHDDAATAARRLAAVVAARGK